MARAFFVDRLEDGSANNKLQVRFSPQVAVDKPFSEDNEAVIPPSRQAATLSGWPSRQHASWRTCGVVQFKLPKWLARRTPARRAAAEEPQPMPRGISLWSCSCMRGAKMPTLARTSM